ncbi:MAG: DUF4430 domain-containing protein [Solirubrobacterales bacterium]|nr:DUF4430 domain-containing protein [Solirubrobacterales bacterium]
MTRSATALVAAALACAAAAGGCGLGPGVASEGRAELRVTREFGTVPMVSATLDDPTESDTVVRMLDANAEIETSYGGNFVDSIDGFAGSTSGGGSEDWFFFVNGYYSDIGSGETRVRPGDRIWWDYRYWSAAYRVPAVVGSWPEPFLHGYEGRTPATVVQCLAVRSTCEEVVGSLDVAGVDARLETPAEPAATPRDLRVLVGPWDAIRDDAAADQLSSGPGTSGVYGSFVSCAAGERFAVDDSRGRTTATLAGAGVVAAVREGRDQPTWIVSGTDDEGVAAAASLLGSDELRDRYAVAVADGEEIPLPSEDVPGESGAGCR